MAKSTARTKAPVATRRRRERQGRFRRSLTLAAASVATLDNIRGMSDAVSDAEIIRRALALYEMVVAKQASGAHVVIRHPRDGDTPVIFL